MKFFIASVGLTAALLGIWACQKDDKKEVAAPEKTGYEVVEQWIKRADTENGELNISFHNVGDIGLAPLPNRPEVVPVLIGGTPADPKDYPATVYSSQGSSRCTATIVGKRVLLIAAHCVGNGKSAVFKAGGKDYSSTCNHHPEYRGNSTADWALCKVNQDIVNVQFESVNTDANAYKVGDKLLLTGFGCTQPGGGGGNDGIYRIGESEITKLPSGTNYDIVTSGGAALCFGDSGGPAFLVTGNSRKQVSVNSRGDIRRVSYLVATATSSFQGFAGKWLVDNNLQMCGMSDQAEGCRGGTDPGPSPNPLPPQCKLDLDKMSNCLFGNPRGALSDGEGCRLAYSNLFACEAAAEVAQ